MYSSSTHSATWGLISDQAAAEYEVLRNAFQAAEEEEKIARQEYWSAKYDTMTDKELQAADIYEKSRERSVTGYAHCKNL